MKNIIITLILMTTLAGVPSAREFWAHFADNLMFNTSVRAGDIPIWLDEHNFSSKETRNLIGRAFAESLPLRIGEVAKQYRFVTLPCTFTPTPEKCYVNIVLGHTFDEVGFVSAPSVSSSVAKKISRMYVQNLRIKGAPHESAALAATINHWKPFSPRFGFDRKNFDFVAANPFYTWYGIYVEPKFGIRNGGVVTLLKRDFVVELSSDGAAFSYRFGKKPHSRNFYTVTWHSDGEVRVDNVLVTW